MSTIYFHSQDRTVGLRGIEHGWMRHLVDVVLLGILSLDDDALGRPHRVRHLFPANHHTHQYCGMEWRRAVENAIMANMDAEVKLGEKGTRWSSIALNTALVMGSDVLKLAARLEAQCEINAYIEGPNRAWLADIITSGRQSRIFRQDVGWEEVAHLLRSRNDTPVVTSHSSCVENSPFPHWRVASYDNQWASPSDGIEATEERWQRLSVDEQWRLCMVSLRRYQPAVLHELKPDNWDSYHFGLNLNAFDLMAWLEQTYPDR